MRRRRARPCLAYQGRVGGLSETDILVVAQIALHYAWPDMVVLFDVDEGTATKRMMGVAKSKKHQSAQAGPTLFCDRMEIKGADSFDQIRQAYLDQATEHPRYYAVINGAGEMESVFKQLLEAIGEKASQW